MVDFTEETVPTVIAFIKASGVWRIPETEISNALKPLHDRDLMAHLEAADDWKSCMRIPHEIARSKALTFLTWPGECVEAIMNAGREGWPEVDAQTWNLITQRAVLMSRDCHDLESARLTIRSSDEHGMRDLLHKAFLLLPSGSSPIQSALECIAIWDECVRESEERGAEIKDDWELRLAFLEKALLLARHPGECSIIAQRCRGYSLSEYGRIMRLAIEKMLMLLETETNTTMRAFCLAKGLDLASSCHDPYPRTGEKQRIQRWCTRLLAQELLHATGPIEPVSVV